MSLKKGSTAPDFVLPSTSGEKFRLKDHLPCIIYFYPKDFTPGCTEEACSFRDGFEELRGLDMQVYGISKDSIDSHQKFKEQHQLPFDLLSDRDGSVCKQYKALVPVVGIPKRVTYLIDSERKVRAVYQDMFGAKKHLGEMINELNRNK
jgi:peroxiredoxin Q/BCP